MSTTADLDEIYQQYSGTVTAYLTRLSGSPELAEELMQETFYRAVKKLTASTEEAASIPGCAGSRSICISIRSAGGNPRNRCRRGFPRRMISRRILRRRTGP